MSWKSNPASAKQMGYLGSLLEQRDWTGREGMVDHIKATQGHMTGAQASAYIDMARSLPWTKRDTTVPSGAASVSQPVTEPGMYRNGETIYRVQNNKAGTALYAKALVPADTKSGWRLQYVAGAIHSLTAAMRMSLGQVEQASALIGACGVCGRTLTAKDSVKAGIGPVCAGRI